MIFRHARTRMPKLIGSFFQYLLLVVLVFPVAPAQISAGGPVRAVEAKLHPALQEIATENPAQVVRVIVQGSGNLDDLRAGITWAGGVLLAELDIINALVVEIPVAGAAQLARRHDVRWVSPDAPTLQSGGIFGDYVVLQENFSRGETATERSVNWNWFELGESDGMDNGDVAITRFLAGSLEGLRIQQAERGIEAHLDLSRAGNGTLSFGYRRKGFTGQNDQIRIEISVDGGASWRLLEQLAGPATDPVLQIAHIDLSAFRAQDTRIRFITSTAIDTAARFYLDFVQVSYQVEYPQYTNTLMLPLVTAQIPDLASAAITYRVRDNFDTTSYANNDGSASWTTSWIEQGDNGSASGGDITVEVDQCPERSNRCIEFDNDAGYNSSVEREVDLTGAAAATLTFDYHLDNSGSTYLLEASADGGSSWSVLESYTSQADVQGETVSLVGYTSAQTRIRFRLTDASGYAHLYIDNVQIEWTGPDNGFSPGMVDSATVRDHFDSTSYSNNDGSATWATGWIESGDNGSPSGGDITVEYDDCPDDNSRCIEFDNDAGYNAAVEREVNLEGATQAILVFDYHLDNHGSTYLLEASADGGYSWSIVKSYTTESRTFNETVDLTPYIGEQTRIRFRLTDASGYSHLYIDNVQIEYGCGGCINTSNLTSTFVRAIGADTLWNGTNQIQGQGVTVAVVDSGVAPHPDFNDPVGDSRILAHADFTGTGSPDDSYGHGTHVAGSIAGNGAMSNGAYFGVAPRANLVDVKVSDDYGMGTTSSVVMGLEWVLNNKDLHNIRVINMSLNSAVAESYHVNPLDAAIEILWFNGIVVVVSSGNNGGGDNTGILYPPANDPFVITVGASDDQDTVDISDDTLAAFSAHGITIEGFTKPEIVVPGTDIIAAFSGDDANLAIDHPDHLVGGDTGSFYFRMSGTSMASAVAAGAAALLIQSNPSLTPDQVKHRLMTTGTQFGNSHYVDIAAAAQATSMDAANGGIEASLLLWSGSDPVIWNSGFTWGSVNWNSVNWNSVNWNSGFTWGSVNWNSTYWGN